MNNNDKHLKEMIERLANSAAPHLKLKYEFEKETDELIEAFTELNEVKLYDVGNYNK